MNLDPHKIAVATKSHEKDVAEALPHLLDRMAKYDSFKNKYVMAAALATVGVECHFVSRNEFGGTEYFTKHYENRKDLGNVLPGDGARFHGRGFIQLTGRANYKKYGDRINVDLLSAPDKANLVPNATAIFVEFFRDHGCDVHAARKEWTTVRRIVNGGVNGLPDFLSAISNLLIVL